MHLAKYIHTSGVPFRHAANKHLIAAFSTLGVTILIEGVSVCGGGSWIIAHITPFVYDIQIKCCRLG